jgi:hypothetical protein
MLLVILYFICCALLSYGIGLMGVWLLRYEEINWIKTVFLGLVGIQILSATWSFFYGLSLNWTLFLAVLAIAGWISNKKLVVSQLGGALGKLSRKRNTQQNPSNSNYLRRNRAVAGLFLVVVCAVAYISSGAPYFIDNESYYIQTIKWLDQYGLVKGVSNVHVFLSQQSGFHILQSALNFDFFYDRFNDLSGFYLLLGFAWSLQKDHFDSALLSNYRTLYPVLFVLGFLFTSVPSPDLPVYVLSYVVVYYFLKLWERFSSEQLLFMSLLIMQMALIKVTSVLLILLVIALLFKYRELPRRWWVQFSLMGSVFAVLFLAKNVVVNGLPFFPVSNWTPLHVSWQLPDSVVQFYMDITVAQAYGISYKDVGRYGVVERCISWWNQVGVEGWLNKSVLLVLCVMLIVALLKRTPAAIKIVFLLFFLQSIILFSSSPQFRFFLNLLIPCAVLIMLVLIELKRNQIISIVVISTACGFFISCLTIFTNRLTDNHSMKNSQVAETHFVLPLPNSHKTITPILNERSGFYYYGFETTGNVFPTYNLPIPAVQGRLLYLIENECGVQPQMNTQDLKDGFKSIPAD